MLMVSCSEGESVPPASVETEGESSQLERAIIPVYHPLSIPDLRERECSAEQLKLLDAVPADEGLYAQEFSYLSEGLLDDGLIERPAGFSPEDR
jgi:hypothetical protein